MTSLNTIEERNQRRNYKMHRSVSGMFSLERRYIGSPYGKICSGTSGGGSVYRKLLERKIV